jgi:hypothetical protein
MSDGSVAVIPRRLLENYLFNAHAIAAWRKPVERLLVAYLKDEEFVKTAHSVKITEWILENAPEQFEELAMRIGTKIRILP